MFFVCQPSFLLMHRAYGSHRATFEEQVEWMKVRDIFEQATLDFIQLQHLDYAGVLSCAHGAQKLTADGITIGFHTRLACFQKPYAAPHDSSITLGSVYNDRIFVLDSKLRAHIMQYASSRSSPSPGLTEVELQELCDRLGEEPEDTGAHSLLRFLEQHDTSEAGKLRPPEAWRHCLHALGTSAPSCQLLPLTCHPAARQLLDIGYLELSEWATVKSESPVLHKMLQDVLWRVPQPGCQGGIDLPAVQLLVKRLLEVNIHNLSHRTLDALRMSSSAVCCRTHVQNTMIMVTKSHGSKTHLVIDSSIWSN